MLGFFKTSDPLEGIMPNFDYFFTLDLFWTQKSIARIRFYNKMITSWPVVNFNRLHLIAFWSVLYKAYFETCSINSKIIQYRQNYKSSIFATAIPTYAQNWYIDEF